jgi:4-amino-4-deoxy-L-arabinose transferase-like glycosyltransferase
MRPGQPFSLSRGKDVSGRQAGKPAKGQAVEDEKGPPPRGPSVLRGMVPLLLPCGLLAAYLMCANLSYGLPLLYHPDEARKVQLATAIARGEVPRYFAHPHFMLNFSVPFIALAKSFNVSPHLAARAAVASLGVATVCLLGFIGRSLAGRLAGVAAALFFATAPLAVVAAHDFKEDIPLAFWLTLQLLFLVRYLTGARLRHLYLAAAALGGAIGTKYTGLAAAPLLVGVLLCGPAVERRWKALGTAALIAAAAFIAVTPAVLVDPVGFVTDAAFEARHAVLGHSSELAWDSAGRVSGLDRTIRVSPVPFLWTYHLRHSLVPGISVAGVLLTLLGAVVALVRGKPGGRIVASGFLLFYVALETLPLKPPPFAARYMVVALPYAALLCGLAVAFAWTCAPAQRIAVGLLFVATIGANVYQVVQQVHAMRPDTRDTARAWIFQRVPPGSRLIIPSLLYYSPIAYASRPLGFPYDAVPSAPRSSMTLANGMDPRAYLIVSSFDYQRYLDHPDVDPEASEFYRLLFDRHSPLATFSVPFQPLGFHNPTIQIYHLGNSPSPPSTAR